MTRQLMVFLLMMCLQASAGNQAAAASLSPGQEFALATGDAVARLQSVEVHRITSDNTIDMVVVLSPPRVQTSTREQMLTQLAEFCLRYQQFFVSAAIPAAERSKINLFAPLYGAEAQQDGFAFQVRGGVCTLEAPFPASIAAKAREAAQRAVQ